MIIIGLFLFNQELSFDNSIFYNKEGKWVKEPTQQKTMNEPTDLIGLFYEKPNQKTSFLSKMIKCLEIAICFIQVSAMIIVTLLLLMRCKSTVKNIQRKCELSCTNQKMERKKRKRGKLKWQNLKI